MNNGFSGTEAEWLWSLSGVAGALVKVDTNTETDYRLLICNPDGTSFTTPNLKRGIAIREVSQCYAVTAGETLEFEMDVGTDAFDLRTVLIRSNAHVCIELYEELTRSFPIYVSNTSTTIYDILNLPVIVKDKSNALYGRITNHGQIVANAEIALKIVPITA